MNHPPERPLRTWFYVVLGAVLGVGLAVMLVLAVVQPTVEIWTGLATVAIPLILIGMDGAIRWFRRRRS